MVVLLALSCVVQWWWKPSRLDIGSRAQILRVGGSIASVVAGAILAPWIGSRDPEFSGSLGPPAPEAAYIVCILLVAASQMVGIVFIVETLRGALHRGQKLKPDTCWVIGAALALAILACNKLLWPEVTR